MEKELEDIKQINHMLENIDDVLELEDDSEIIETYLKQKHALETALNYIENSIATSVVEEKIDKLEKQKQEKEKILEEVNNVIQKQQSTESELDGAYQYYDETYDEKEKIIYQLQILQELLQEKGEK